MKLLRGFRPACKHFATTRRFSGAARPGVAIMHAFVHMVLADVPQKPVELARTFIPEFGDGSSQP
ncbi:hypothetical protein WN72_02410 [Bradyrhizobium arachidis]|uniref:Uncharacterized protein n=1 Tax=Bradyrhizobium arachidis TaxID=858423 RepID=A0AAE7NN45_9BRAD|nr:hypothetical protein WN72_02410 [Bradyrhizobium arachidis]